MVRFLSPSFHSLFSYVQSAVPLHEHTPADVTIRRQQSRYLFHVDDVKLQPISALVRRHTTLLTCLVHMLLELHDTRDIDIAILPVRPSVRHVPVITLPPSSSS